MNDKTILEVVASNLVSADRLSLGEEQELRTEIDCRWAITPLDSVPLWERLHEPVGRHIADGWRLVCEYAGLYEVILFFNAWEDSGMWKFSSGQALLQVLEECPAMELYTTNPTLDYVLCHNHHDYLVGVGSCKPWLSGLDDDACLSAR